jgi:5-methylcytosine-specific restriction endonuclease McrA
MSNDCLVLNSSYIPIETVSWQEAFTKIFNGRAYAVEYYEEIVKTPNDEYFKPAIIVCTEYNKIPNRVSVYSKRMVYIRDNYLCQYCTKQLNSTTATIDHVVPRSKGGRSTFENTVASCGPCNSRKANKMLSDTNMFLIKEPKAPNVNPIKAKFARTIVRPEWELYLAHWVG